MEGDELIAAVCQIDVVAGSVPTAKEKLLDGPLTKEIFFTQSECSIAVAIYDEVLCDLRKRIGGSVNAVPQSPCVLQPLGYGNDEWLERVT
jgi:hypothetical protein